MLKGKKKALAAQVLLGLMVAGNAYAATDITVENADGVDWGTMTVDGNNIKCGGDAFVVSNGGVVHTIIGENGFIQSAGGDIRDYNVEIKVATVGKNPGGSFTLIKGSNVENNTVTIGEYWPRAIKGWDSSELKDIFVGTDSSVNNKLRLGILDYRPDPYNEGNPPKTVVTSIDVGIGNDIELVGGKADGLTADYKGISFVGRNLTLSDADGTEQIKSANMQGTVTATRALNVTEDLIASGDITANGGLTAGGNIKGANISTASHALKGNVITANGDITSGTLDANDVYAKSITASGNINVTGVIKLINANARAVAGDIIGNSITASSIVANNVTATAGDIIADSINTTGWSYVKI